MFTKYRIIYVKNGNDPCHWQVQERIYFVFWKNINLSFSSATTAGNELIQLMENSNGMLNRILTWFDKRYVITRHAQRCQVLAQQTGQSFEQLYDTKNS